MRRPCSSCGHYWIHPKPGPYVVEAYAVLSKYYDEQEQALRLAEDVLKNFRMGPPLLARLHYRAGDLYDGLEDYDRAFHHYKAANDALPVQFNEHQYDEFIQIQSQFFTKSVLAGFAYANMHSEVPVLFEHA